MLSQRTLQSVVGKLVTKTTGHVPYVGLLKFICVRYTNISPPYDTLKQPYLRYQAVGQLSLACLDVFVVVIPHHLLFFLVIWRFPGH